MKLLLQTRECALAAWSRVLLEKLIVVLASREIPRMEPAILIAVFTRARRFFLSLARLIHSTLSLFSLKFILTSFHQRFGLPSGNFPLGFLTWILCAFLFFFRTWNFPRPSHPPWFYHPISIRKLLIMQLSPAPCYFLPLRPPPAPYSRTTSEYFLPLMWKTKFHTHAKQET